MVKTLLAFALAVQNVVGFQSITPLLQHFPRSDGNSVVATPITPAGIKYDTVSRRGTALQAKSSDKLPARHRRTRSGQRKDVVIIGGGLAGLSVALYLSEVDPDRQVTVLDREDESSTKGKTSVASFAAAGMLAPNSERLPKGDYLDLCLASKQMYPDFIDLVEYMAREAGEEAEKFLWSKTGSDDSGLENWNVGYVASGGFLAPAFAGDSVATWAPPDQDGSAIWLDSFQVRELEPNVNPDVVGGWWFPEDSSVDARRLTCSMKAACIGAGVQFLTGSNYEVTSLNLEDGQCKGVWLKKGKYMSAKAVLVANGAWMRNLLPVPLEPHKGQSLSLRMPKDRPPILRRVLFAQNSYIVPKADGRIVIGATVEAGSFDPNVTPAGIMHILQHALELVPGLAELPMEETWAGLRPTTPDKGPIMGKTPWEGLFLAGGYWRNGVLLAPKTGELLASLIANVEMSEEDEAMLNSFAWDRFTSKDGGAKMAANSRYAAAMYPIQTRRSGAGVAASVGTELGSYSTAKSAGEERKKDRDSLWGGGDDDAFERAASMGKQDANAFSGFGDNADIASSSALANTASETDTQEQTKTNPAFSLQAATTMPFSGSKADAFTVGIASPTSEDESASVDDTSSIVDTTTSTTSSDGGAELSSIYQSIRENKAKQPVELPDELPDERPDPGFRIYHVDSETGESREVPPYTQPGAFLAKIREEKMEKSKSDKGSSSTTTTTTNDAGVSDSDENTFDGYTSIQEAAAASQDNKKAMREARMKNRDKLMSQVKLDLNPDDYPDFSKAPNEDSEEISAPAPAPDQSSVSLSSIAATSDLDGVYETIRQNKAATKPELGPEQDERPDPGFRIYHVDSETGESRMVPPYTQPGTFLASIAEEKQARSQAPSAPEAVVDGNASQGTSGVPEQEGDDGDYNEKTFDGYQSIQNANSRQSRAEELQAMKEARRLNRLGQAPINEDDLHL